MHSHGIEFHSIGKSKVSYTVNSKPHHYDNIEGEWSSGSMPMRHSALPAKGRKGLARSTADQLYFQASGCMGHMGEHGQHATPVLAPSWDGAPQILNSH